MNEEIPEPKKRADFPEKPELQIVPVPYEKITPMPTSPTTNPDYIRDRKIDKEQEEQRRNVDEIRKKKRMPTKH